MALANSRAVFRRYPLVVPRYEYRDFNGRAGVCGIEVLLARTRPRIVVIATELKDNPAMSITNAAELVASQVCRAQDANPLRFVWIEHYGYPAPTVPSRPRSYDLVTFHVNVHADACFSRPHWRVMTDADWIELGLPPRSAGP